MKDYLPVSAVEMTDNTLHNLVKPSRSTLGSVMRLFLVLFSVQFLGVVEGASTVTSSQTVPVTMAPSSSTSTRSSSTRSAAKINYGVLLDAGSSSTKLKIYSWTKSNTSVVPKILLLLDKRFDPAISSYEDNEAGLVEYLRGITSTAQSLVPKEAQAETPIYLMATAGLRFLSEDEATSFVEKTRTVLANQSVNPFLYSPSNVNIISGEKEGVYSWIAANYLRGYFDSYSHSTEQETVGVLEMGGGSTQITFIPRGPIFSEEYQVIVAMRPYQLYVHSYLYFGANYIKLRIAYELAQRQNSTTVDNPCMLIDDTKFAELEDKRNITMRGSSDPLACLALLKDILKPDTDILCQPKPCAIGGVYQPKVDTVQFLATQAFTYTPIWLLKLKDGDVLRIDLLQEAAIAHCNRSLSQAMNESGTDQEFASEYCVMGLYIPTLLSSSYGFPRNSTNIRLASKINNVSVDWALGAMLVELTFSFGNTDSQILVSCKTESTTKSVRGGSPDLQARSLYRGLLTLLLSLTAMSVVRCLLTV